MSGPSTPVLPAGFIPTWFAVSINPFAGGSGRLYSRRCLYGGMQVIGAASPDVTLFDGLDANGQLIAQLGAFSPGGGGIGLAPWPGVLVNVGLFVVVDPAARGVVYVSDLP